MAGARGRTVRAPGHRCRHVQEGPSRAAATCHPGAGRAALAPSAPRARRRRHQGRTGHRSRAWDASSSPRAAERARRARKPRPARRARSMRPRAALVAAHPRPAADRTVRVRRLVGRRTAHPAGARPLHLVRLRGGTWLSATRTTSTGRGGAARLLTRGLRDGSRRPAGRSAGGGRRVPGRWRGTAASRLWENERARRSGRLTLVSTRTRGG